MNTQAIGIREVVGSPIWVSTDDGQKVFRKITEAFAAGHRVNLSFANGKTMVTAFLNAAIGQLYDGKYDEGFINEHLQYSDIEPDDMELVVHAVNNTRRYFANPEACDQAWRDVVGVEEFDEEE